MHLWTKNHQPYDQVSTNIWAADMKIVSAVKPEIRRLVNWEMCYRIYSDLGFMVVVRVFLPGSMGTSGSWLYANGAIQPRDTPKVVCDPK